MSNIPRGNNLFNFWSVRTFYQRTVPYFQKNSVGIDLRVWTKGPVEQSRELLDFFPLIFHLSRRLLTFQVSRSSLLSDYGLVTVRHISTVLTHSPSAFPTHLSHRTPFFFASRIVAYRVVV